MTTFNVFVTTCSFNSTFLGPAVRSGERSGASAHRFEPSATEAKLGGASGAYAKRDWRNPVSEHASISAATHAVGSQPRDSVCRRHAREEGMVQVTTPVGFCGRAGHLK